MENEVISLATPIIGTLFIILLAYLVTKLISVRYAKMSTGRYMRVLERTTMGQDKALVLIEINNKVILIGVTGKNINTVCEFSKEEFSLEPEISESKFSSLLTECLKKHPVLQLQRRDKVNEDKK